jgi:hypothetical protein
MFGLARRLPFGIIFVAAFWSIAACGQSDTSAQLSFGRIKPDQEIQQVIHFSNPTGDQLRISEIQLTPPLLARQISKAVAPHSSGQFTLTLGEPRQYGQFDGWVRINFVGNAIDPIIFSVEGFVIPPIEFRPYAAFFLATHAGKHKSAVIDIINHREEPLVLVGAVSSSKRFRTTLEPVEVGQHYRLKLLLDGNAQPGEEVEEIRLLADPPTDSPLIVQANTIIRTPVYHFPTSVNFGAIELGIASGEDSSKSLSQTLMVYRPETTDFEIEAMVDLDFLELASERGPDGDRYQITVSLIPEKVVTGEFSGALRIETNDEDYKVLNVQISGHILD